MLDDKPRCHSRSCAINQRTHLRNYFALLETWGNKKGAGKLPRGHVTVWLQHRRAGRWKSTRELQNEVFRHIHLYTRANITMYIVVGWRVVVFVVWNRVIDLAGASASILIYYQEPPGCTMIAFCAVPAALDVPRTAARLAPKISPLIVQIRSIPTHILRKRAPTPASNPSWLHPPKCIFRAWADLPSFGRALRIWLRLSQLLTYLKCLAEVPLKKCADTGTGRGGQERSTS